MTTWLHRIDTDDIEWLHRKLASLAKDTEGTKEGQRWKKWHDRLWEELEYRRANPTNGNEPKP
jgi:uncharacterized membrane protein YgaE (UPF0421/DUF939 family)